MIRAGATLTDSMRRQLREEHSDARSREFLARLRLSDAARCVEVGAGLGSMARWMATSLVPQGHVLATEVRQALVEVIVRPGIGNLQAVQHDLRVEPLPEREVDLIFSRYVLEHIAERDTVISRLREHLRPGGWLVVEDACFVDGPLTGPPDYRSAMWGFVRSKSGSDYHWASGLPELMESAGLSDLHAERRSDLFKSGSVTAQFWASLLAQESAVCQAAGTVDVSTVDRAVDLLLHGSSWFGGPFIVQCAGQYAPEIP